MKIDLVAETALTTVDDRAIADLIAASFNTDFGGRSFYKQRHHLRILAYDNGLIGHMALCLRAIRLGRDLVDIAGLAEVCTHPAHRGKGVATKMLETAISAADATLAEYLVLFGDAPLYAANGFVRQSNKMTFAVMDDAWTRGLKTDTDDGLMVLPLRQSAWPRSAALDLLGPVF